MLNVSTTSAMTEMVEADDYMNFSAKSIDNFFIKELFLAKLEELRKFVPKVCHVYQYTLASAKKQTKVKFCSGKNGGKKI